MNNISSSIKRIPYWPRPCERNALIVQIGCARRVYRPTYGVLVPIASVARRGKRYDLLEKARLNQ